MKAHTILMIAGAVVAAKLVTARHHHHAEHGHQPGHRPGSGCHGPHGQAYLHQPEWRGLTETEARTKLTDRLGDDLTAVDEAIDFLDAHGYLARMSEPVEL